MVKQVVWTANAMQDRIQILEYWLVLIGNDKYASYLNNCVEEAANTISVFSEIGRVYEETHYRFIVKDNYMLFYKFDDKTIYSLSIFDGRRNEENIEKKLKRYVTPLPQGSSLVVSK